MLKELNRENLWSSLPFKADQSPPLWVIGSGMTVAQGGQTVGAGEADVAYKTHMSGVPGTHDLALSLTNAWKSTFSTRRTTAAADSLLVSAKDMSPYAFYQEATKLYYGAHGTPDVSQTNLMHEIRRAVLSGQLFGLNVDDCEQLEKQVWEAPRSWQKRGGMSAIASYIACHPNRRDHAIFTTNFDPLMSVALLTRQVNHARAAFEHQDYALSRIAADVPVIYHVHGYWTGANVLNLHDDMVADNRQSLAKSVAELMDKRTVVIAGYGGWDDIITKALCDILRSDATRIIWILYGNSELPPVIDSAAKNSPGQLSTIRVDDVDALLGEIEKSALRDKAADSRGAANAMLSRELDIAKVKLSKRKDHKRLLDEINHNLKAAIEEMKSLARKLEPIYASAASHSNTAASFEEHRRVQSRRLYFIMFASSVAALASVLAAIKRLFFP